MNFTRTAPQNAIHKIIIDDIGDKYYTDYVNNGVYRLYRCDGNEHIGWLIFSNTGFHVSLWNKGIEYKFNQIEFINYTPIIASDYIDAACEKIYK